MRFPNEMVMLSLSDSQSTRTTFAKRTVVRTRRRSIATAAMMISNIFLLLTTAILRSTLWSGSCGVTEVGAYVLPPTKSFHLSSSSTCLNSSSRTSSINSSSRHSLAATKSSIRWQRHEQLHSQRSSSFLVRQQQQQLMMSVIAVDNVVQQQQLQSPEDNENNNNHHNRTQSQSQSCSLRTTMRKITGFSLTSLRATLRAATGISLSRTLKNFIGVFPIWVRFIFQPLLILYYWPLFLLRNLFGLSAGSKLAQRDSHNTLTQTWMIAVTKAQEALFLGEFTEFVETEDAAGVLSGIEVSNTNRQEKQALATDMIIEAEQMFLAEEEEEEEATTTRAIMNKEGEETMTIPLTTTHSQQQQQQDIVDKKTSSVSLSTTALKELVETKEEESSSSSNENKKKEETIAAEPLNLQTQTQEAMTTSSSSNTVATTPTVNTDDAITATSTTILAPSDVVTEATAATSNDRSDKAASDVDFSGVWLLKDSDDFKHEYDMYLKALGQPQLVRAIALSLIGFTREEIIQTESGRILQINGINPRGIWNRQLVSSTSDEPIYSKIQTADGETVEVEAWWEASGTTHVSWLRGGKKYGGGDFESRRYLEENGKILVCQSVFHPRDPNMKKTLKEASSNHKTSSNDIQVTWRFQRET